MSGADGGDVTSLRDPTTTEKASVVARAAERGSLPAGVLARPYQAEAARLGAAALRRRGNTLQVLPTGAGKTVVALLTAREAGFKRILVVVHRATATPERGDGHGLHRVFDNVSVALPLRELVDGGFLVPPRAFMFDLAPPDLVDAVVRGASDFGEQQGVAAVLNTPERNAEAVRLWAEKAADRRTIAFTSTVAHADAMAEAWRNAGYRAEMISGETPSAERQAILRRLQSGVTQIVSNAMVLTEGFDEPLVGCVALLRGCGSKSLMIQTAGRALRTLDAGKYPGMVKTDAIVLDFGRSLARHGDLIAGARLDDRPDAAAPMKRCPGCGGEVPVAVAECPLCGHVFAIQPRVHDGDTEQAAIEMRRAAMIEVDVLAKSQFSWSAIGDDGLIAVGFDGAAALRHMGAGVWVAVGLPREGRAVPLRVGPRYLALSAADDFLRMTESGEGAHKTKEWLERPPTAKQLELLARDGIDGRRLSRYSAACRLNWQWQRRRITAAALEGVRK